MEDKDKLIELVVDTKNDYRDISKTVTKILIVSLIINLILASIFFVSYNMQRKGFLLTIEKQQTEFLDFISQYDFETTTEIITDNESVNNGNIDIIK